MTWANVDDLFPEHPKVLAAGGDAAWLYICGLCFTNRNLTEGRIPKAVVPRLSDRKAPARLAQRLVEVGLWHEDRDAYVIHDWEKYNEGAEAVKARKEQARNAARTRWSGRPKSAQSNAGSNADPDPPPPDQQCGQHAVSMSGAHAGAMPSHSSPTTEHRSSSSNHGVGDQPAEEEEPDFVVGRACQLAAERRLSARTAGQTPVVDRSAWLAKTAATIRLQHADQLAELVAEGAGVDALVASIDPPAVAPPSPYLPAGQQSEPIYDQVLNESGEWVTVRVGA
jgi:hypothetical protein